MEDFDFVLAGANFRDADTKYFIRNELAPGHSVTFKREPDNRFDALAIQVIATNLDGEELFIGFVPKTDNVLFAPYLDNDGECTGKVVAFVGDIRPIIRVAFPNGTA